MNERHRVALLLLLSLTLVWSLVAFGTVEKVPTDSIRNKSTKQVLTTPESHIGDRVIVDGTVASTDPIVVRLRESSVQEMTVTGIDRRKLAVGNRVYVIGTLTGPSRIAGDSVMVQKPWEKTAMHMGSFVGGLLVLGQVRRHWRFSWRERALVPRTDDSARDGEDG
ncbi:hypothetical protein [Haloarcula nitratireducens]|uniref:DUF5666 domain-containing protein n=1 Tax=Haloarcula nitratireducens TaxID=2487749 RepID=A0AAW4PIB3_9EURY|nr:hypothetical protein [Halomicroarcula nitratireducens]MBX0297765.1 hypothetical protein [Halomicroarcula nitratireducens]